MANSVNPACNAFKRQYDSCFNTWFEQYLNTSLPSSGNNNSKPDPEVLRSKGKELESKCGDLFKTYRRCIESDLEAKGLNELLNEARDAEPLHKPGDTNFPNFKS